MKIRVLLVDDEPLARERLRRLLQQEADVEIVGEASDGPSAITLINSELPDLLLLDVRMPGMDGFAVLKGIEKLPLVVFVTAFDQYALSAFEQRAVDYLLKPVSQKRLAETMSRIRERLASPTRLALPKDLVTLLATHLRTGTHQRFSIRNGEKIIFVAVEDVDWIEASGNYAILHCGKENHLLRQTLNSLEAQLPKDSFIRASRSAILNLRRVKELRSLADEEIVAVLADGSRVRVTRGLREMEQLMRNV